MATKLQAHRVALITHQPDLPLHIQASLPLTPMSSMHFLGPEVLRLCKKFLSALSFCVILRMVFTALHGYTQHDSNA
jgi:Na+-driven multidrug efflux pump